MDDLSDLRKLDLPFDIDELDPYCHGCIRNQVNKYKLFIGEDKNVISNKFIVDCKGIKKTTIPPEIRVQLDDEQIEELEAINDVVKFAKKYFKDDDGGPWTARSYQEYVLRCTSPRKVLRISRRAGKCIAGESNIISTYGPITAKELFLSNTKPDIVSFNQDTGCLTSTPNYTIWENGVKDTYKITTQFGKETVVTDNHPFLTMDKNGEMVWKETKDLCAGEYLFVPASYSNIKFNESSLDGRTARLLGYLTGDGTLGYKYASRFTNINDAVLEDIKSLVADFDCWLNPLDEQSYIIVSKNLETKHRNKINALLDLHDMRHKAVNKRVPKDVLCGSKEVIVNFLAGYWDTDGWACLNKPCRPKSLQKPEIGVGTASKQLAKDVQFLLLRIGIFSNLSYRKVKYKDSFRDNWVVVVVDKDNIENFCSQITLVGKQDKLDQVRFVSNQKEETTSHCMHIPRHIAAYIKKQQKQQKLNFEQYKKENGISIFFQLSRKEQSAMTRNKISKFAKFLNNDEYLTWLSTNDFVWEKIISIDYVGKQMTYDLNVPETSTIIADNIISHNTASSCISICHKMLTQAGIKILVVGPQKTHVEEIFTRVKSLIKGSVLKDSIQRDISAPWYELTLKNGSRIRGFAGLTKGKKDGQGVRGQDADIIYCEEMDLIDQDALNGAVFPILHTKTTTELVGFSTPTGFKTAFYRLCKEAPKYKEFHYTYKVLPHWRMVELERPSMGLTEHQWRAEYLAEFSDSDIGVYKPTYIDRALADYNYDGIRKSHWKYTIGTDWNEKYGTEIVVLGIDPLTQTCQVVDAQHIEKSEFTQLAGVSKLLEMNRKWKPSAVYIDSGNGSTNAELLRKTAYDCQSNNKDPETAKLLQTLKKYDSGAGIEIKDPVTGQPRKAPAKPFMVNSAVILFEQNKVKISAQDVKLEQQLRNYIVDRINPNGVTVYGVVDAKIGDHRLDAFNLACVAFTLEFNDLYKQIMSQSFGPAQDGRIFQTVDGETKAVVPQSRDIQEGLFVDNVMRANSGFGTLKTNRPGWDTDTEEQELVKYAHRKLSAMRQKRSVDRPTRSNI